MVKKKKKKSWGLRLSLIAVIGIGTVIALGAYLILLKGNVRQNTYLYIPTGASLEQVKDSLNTHQCLYQSSYFDVLQRILEYRVKPGRYHLQEGQGTWSIVRMLQLGHQSPSRLVLTHARTLGHLAASLGRQLEADSATFMAYFRSDSLCKAFNITREGLISRFIPNTYEIWWNSSPDQVMARMNREYHLFWNETRIAKAEQKGLSPLQVSILASIIEEETRQNDEKPLMASTYLNRLRIGMPLQADPTARFAVGDFTARRITKEHLQSDSPYNTYRNRGLPPGPICMPSIASIDAVLNAPKTSYLYFCARADFSGYHLFAATHEEHMANARAYHRALNASGVK